MHKKHLLIHTGLPKTGTTSLQAYLANVRADLELSNWHYPEVSVNRRGIAHNPLALALNKAKSKSSDFELAYKLFEDALQSNCENCIISAEEFTNLISNTKSFGNFKTLIEIYSKEFEITTYSTHIHISKFLESMMIQNMKMLTIKNAGQALSEYTKERESYLFQYFNNMDFISRKTDCTVDVRDCGLKKFDSIDLLLQTIGIKRTEPNPDRTGSAIGNENLRLSAKKFTLLAAAGIEIQQRDPIACQRQKRQLARALHRFDFDTNDPRLRIVDKSAATAVRKLLGQLPRNSVTEKLPKSLADDFPTAVSYSPSPLGKDDLILVDGWVNRHGHADAAKVWADIRPVMTDAYSRYRDKLTDALYAQHA